MCALILTNSPSLLRFRGRTSIVARSHLVFVSCGNHVEARASGTAARGEQDRACQLVLSAAESLPCSLTVL